jgi:hypothetical protein
MRRIREAEAPRSLRTVSTLAGSWNYSAKRAETLVRGYWQVAGKASSLSLQTSVEKDGPKMPNVAVRSMGSRDSLSRLGRPEIEAEAGQKPNSRFIF